MTPVKTRNRNTEKTINYALTPAGENLLLRSLLRKAADSLLDTDSQHRGDMAAKIHKHLGRQAEAGKG